MSNYVMHTKALKAKHEKHAERLKQLDSRDEWHSPERVVYIEYHDKRPHSVTTEQTSYYPRRNQTPAAWYNGYDHYDVDDGMIHKSGAGGGCEFNPGKLLHPSNPPDCQVWAATHCILPDDATMRANGFQRIKRHLGNPWEADDAREVDGTVYCGICKEWFADDDHCKHVFFTENGYAGPGSDEPDSDSVRDSFLDVMQETRLTVKFYRALKKKDFRLMIFTPLIGAQHCNLYLCGHNYGDRFSDMYDDVYANGLNWIQSLNFTDTPDAINITIKWLEAHMGIDGE